MKIQILACVVLILLSNSNCTLHDKFDQVILSSTKPVRLSTTTAYHYIDLKIARKVCTEASKKYCPITEAEIFAIQGSRRFLYRTGDFTGASTVSNVGGFIGLILKDVLKDNSGTTIDTKVKITASTGFSVAVVLSNLSLVKNVVGNYSLFKFDARLVFGYEIANGAAVKTRFETDAVTTTNSLGLNISTPYQVITGVTVTASLFLTTATITNGTCYKAFTNTDLAVANTGVFWFKSGTSNLLDTALTTVNTGNC